MNTPASRSPIKAALPSIVRADICSRLPPWVVPAWFGTRDEGLTACADAEICWLHLDEPREIATLIEAATAMRWFNTIYTGLDGFPLDILRHRAGQVTNGAGLNAITIAEYVVMGMLTIAKGYREVVRAQDRREWLSTAPGKQELAGSRALIVGYGEIGKLIAERVKSFGVEVMAVRRSATGDDGFLDPGQWRERLGEFDWIVLAVPATAETVRMIGRRELVSMRTSAVLINVARGTLVDQDALVDALQKRHIAGAFLDVTDPEPLAPSHPLWGMENVHISMHLSGRSQTRTMERAVSRFLDNLCLYAAGSPLKHAVDLDRGY